MPYDYERDISIDESILDVEWIEHSSRMLTYTTLAAEARREMDLAEASLDYCRARISKEVREDPDFYGLGGTGPSGRSRATEEAIKNTIILNEEYDVANREYIEKKFQWEVAIGVVKSFEHRKSALENLVRLHGQSYFAGPIAPHNLSEERTRRADRTIRFHRGN